MGAAYLAGLAVGYWKDLDEIRRNWASDRIFAPQITAEVRKQRLQNWHRAVDCATFWSKNQPNS
jgi:glycerol kinase